MRHAIPKGLLVAALAVSSACAPTATNDAAPAEAVAAAPKPAPQKALAEATDAASGLHVEVLQAKRTQDTVRIELAFTYTPVAASVGAQQPPASAPAQSTSQGQQPLPEPPLSLLRALGAGGRPGVDANPDDFFLLTVGVRLYVLHDAEGKPVLEGNWQQPLQPRERRVLAASFPAPRTAPATEPATAPDVHVALMLGRFLMKNVPIS